MNTTTISCSFSQLINYYMKLIVLRSKQKGGLPKCHAMSTFFFPKLNGQSYNTVSTWTKEVDIFSLDLVFYPIHLGVHWTLAVSTIYINRMYVICSVFRILSSFFFLESNYTYRFARQSVCAEP